MEARHPIVLKKGSKAPVIPIGNGELCFTGDRSGLQGTAGNTMAHWAWHSFPLPEGVNESQLSETGSFNTGRLQGDGRDDFSGCGETVRSYMFDNQHLFNLARLCFSDENGAPLPEDTFDGAESVCDIVSGLVTSVHYENGIRIKTETCVHGTEDILGIRISCGGSRPSVLLVFPYPSLKPGIGVSGSFGLYDRHSTSVSADGPVIRISRNVDGFRYYADVSVNGMRYDADPALHRIIFHTVSEEASLVIRFTPDVSHASLPSFDDVLKSSAAEAERFRENGGAIDVSGSTNGKWFEFERRMVLSRYLERVQSRGSWPCAEAGLMFMDGWRSQFHMEMVYWHTAHFYMWNDPEANDRQLNCYRSFLPMAEKLAAQLGYRGAKWGKSCTPTGRTAPWEGNLALLWKQPHPMTFAELEYRNRPTRETLEKWADILDRTAEHMADYVTVDRDGYYHLRPSMPPSELGFTYDTLFDLVYWKWGLEEAQLWRERMGRERVPEWDDIAEHMAPLPEKDGLYIRSPEYTETYTKQNYEHPDMVGILGMIPQTDYVSRSKVRDSLVAVWEKWDRNRIWGWDFPWIAMCASRVGEPSIAVDAMLSVDMDEAGASARGSYPYLPANGGFLYAAAMMAVGPCGENAPGFDSADGWVVRSENIISW